jgi:hypothetical protein
VDVSASPLRASLVLILVGIEMDPQGQQWELKDQKAVDILHVPACVLQLCIALCLGMDEMCLDLLEILEQTALRLHDFFKDETAERELEQSDISSFRTHLHNALDIVYTEVNQLFVFPLRRVLAAIMDASMLFMVKQPEAMNITHTSTWKKHSEAICEDVYRYRKVGRESLSRSVMSRLVEDCSVAARQVQAEIVWSAQEAMRAGRGELQLAQLLDSQQILGGQARWSWPQR